MTGVDDPRPEDDIALAGEYVLGLLGPTELTVVERRLAEDEAFATLVSHWESELAALAEAEVEAVAPPAHVHAALRRELFADQDRPWWRRLGIGQAVIGAVAASMLLFAAVNLGWLAPDAPARPTKVAEITAEDRSLLIAAAYVPEEQALFVERQAGGPLPGRVLELWLIPEGGAPVSLGILPEDTLTRVAVPEDLAPALTGGLLAVSDEPPGGSTTGAPTGSVLAAGSVTEL